MTEYERALSSFLCNYVKSYLDRHHSSKAMLPTAEECFSAVVMVDVSGYSKLAAMLAERGSLGTELLSKTMNGYLDKIIAIIHSHGGDIVKFAGDALIFYWMLDKEEIDSFTDEFEFRVARGEMVIRACECCLDLLDKLGIYVVDIPDCDVKELRIHLGVGAGTLYNVHVGGEPGRWEHFVAGDAINQLGTVLDLAKPGQLAVSHAALRCVGAVIDVKHLNLGDYDKRCIILDGIHNAIRNIKYRTKRRRKNNRGRITEEGDDEGDMNDADNDGIVDSDKTALYAKYVNESGLFKLNTGEVRLTQHPGELRQVTTIFVKIGLHFETDESLGVSQEAMTIIQRTLKRQEGMLRQFIVDDKGAVILMYFGLPPLAHKDDAFLGLEAALLVCASLRRIFEDFSIGVCTGMVWAGGVGNSRRSDYAVVGDSVNMAARLMCNPKSKTNILCDERTYELTKTRIQFEDLGTIKVKGKQHPIKIFRPMELLTFRRHGWFPMTTGMLSGTGNMPPPLALDETIIGRGKVKETIKSTMKRYGEHGFHTTFILEGEEGMGVTTMGTYFMLQAELFGYHHLVGRARDMDQTTPFFAYQEIVVDMFRLIEEITSGKSAAHRSGSRDSMDSVDDLKDKLKKIANEDLHAYHRRTLIQRAGDNRVLSFHYRDKDFPKASPPIISADQTIVKDETLLRNTNALADNCIPNPSHSSPLSPPINIASQGRQSDMGQGTSNTLRLFERRRSSQAWEGRPSMAAEMKRRQSKGVVERLTSPTGTMENCSSTSADSSTPSSPPMNVQHTSGDHSNSLLSPDHPYTLHSLGASSTEVKSLAPSSTSDIGSISAGFGGGNARVGRRLSFAVSDPDLSSRTKTKMMSVNTQENSDPELEDCIIRGLSAMGEDPELAPLFSLILPIQFTVTDRCNNIVRNMRTHELTNLLVRLLRKLSVLHPLFLVLEQVQWLDPLSWRLTDTIILACPRLIVCLFSRPDGYYPEGEYGTILFKRLKQREGVVKILLEGLPQSETKDLILQTLGDIAKDVVDDIVQSIHERSRGNPLFVQKLTTFMTESKMYRVNDEGLLSLPVDVKSIDVMVPGNDLESIVVAQFDKLDAGLQAFLRVASVMGQQFFLQDSLLFVENAKLKQNVTAHNIKLMDKYNFIEKVHVVAVGPVDMFRFTSTIIQKTIYSMIAHSQRQKLHSDLAVFYEQQMLNGRADLLLVVYQHYLQADNKPKVKQYLELVATHFFKMNSMHETIKHYTLLFQLVDEPNNVEEAKSTTAVQTDNLRIVLRLRRSKWHRELGEAYLSVGDLKNSEHHILEALKLCDFTFHSSGGLRMSLHLKQEQATHKRLWRGQSLAQSLSKPQPDHSLPKRTGSLGSHKKSGSQKSSTEHASISNARLCILSLCDLYFQREDEVMFQYGVVTGLNLSESLEKDFVYAVYVAMEGLAQLTGLKPNPTIAWDYLTAAEEIIKSDIDCSSSHISSVHEYIGSAQFIVGKWKEASESFDIVLKQASGDRMKFERVCLVKSWMQFHQGEFDKSLKIAKDLFLQSKIKNYWTGQCLGLSMSLYNFLTQARSEEMKASIQMINDIYKLGDESHSWSLSIQIIYLGIITDTCLRLKVKDDLWGKMRAVTKLCGKVKGNHWAAMIGLEHLIHALFTALDENLFDDVIGTKKIACDFLEAAVKALRLFQTYIIASPLRVLARSLLLLIRNKEDEAVACLREGLQDIGLSTMPYLMGLVNAKIAKYTRSLKEKRECSTKANDIFGWIGAVHEGKANEGSMQNLND